MYCSTLTTFPSTVPAFLIDVCVCVSLCVCRCHAQTPPLCLQTVYAFALFTTLLRIAMKDAKSNKYK